MSIYWKITDDLILSIELIYFQKKLKDIQEEKNVS